MLSFKKYGRRDINTYRKHAFPTITLLYKQKGKLLERHIILCFVYAFDLMLIGQVYFMDQFHSKKLQKSHSNFQLAVFRILNIMLKIKLIQIYNQSTAQHCEV